MEGGLIQWQKWNIRTSFNYREGLVLHNVTYNDAGRERPILHRASLVEASGPWCRGPGLQGGVSCAAKVFLGLAVLVRGSYAGLVIPHMLWLVQL